MPRHQVDADIIDNGDGTATITVDGFGFTVSTDSLFDRVGLDEDQIRDNVILAYQIGGYAEPNSVEFLNGVNKGIAGMETRGGNLTIQAIDLIDIPNQIYRITWLWKSGLLAGQQYSMQIRRDQFDDPTTTPETVVRNIPAALRKAGHTHLSAAAIALVKSRKYWY